MMTKTSAENARHYKSRYLLIVERILTFLSSPNFVRKVQNMPPISDREIRFVIKLCQFHHTLCLDRSVYRCHLTCKFLFIPGILVLF